MADDIPNRGPQLMGINCFFAAAAFLAVLLRSYVRAVIVKRFALDDWLMLTAMVLFEIYCGVSTAGVYHGTGRHHADLEDYEIKNAMHFWWFCYLFYSTTMIASKLSIALFLLRLVVSKAHKWVIYIAMVLGTIAGLTFFFVSTFQCYPVSYFWNRDQEGKCLNPGVIVALAMIYSVFAVVSDLTFVAIPVVLVWNLNMKLKARLSLIPLLSMGCIASAAVIVRFPYLLKLNSDDFLWDTLDTAIWSTVEQGLAITAGSLATVRPLLRIMSIRFGWTSQASNATPGNELWIGRPSRLKSAHREGEQAYGGPGSSIARNTSYHDRKKDLPLTPFEASRDEYGCNVYIGAEGSADPMAKDRIVVTTSHMQSVDQKIRKNESEESLARDRSSSS
ncbi:related to integral membrane protein PTH11 [Cephalotrichum gorgonifer]|uniref:Related to integral membrane protein PTH11 n=1 Tax=Cephalotrichum gorgonifer TaxID=2041049 RepID=A0AAE8N3B8_9PEZI|nr:related to integral membrane protein PTH11 [Cephalotrichum gorgonifer]